MKKAFLLIMVMTALILPVMVHAQIGAIGGPWTTTTLSGIQKVSPDSGITTTTGDNPGGPTVWYVGPFKCAEGWWSDSTQPGLSHDATKDSFLLDVDVDIWSIARANAAGNRIAKLDSVRLFFMKSPIKPPATQYGIRGIKFVTDSASFKGRVTSSVTALPTVLNLSGTLNIVGSKNLPEYFYVQVFTAGDDSLLLKKTDLYVLPRITKLQLRE